MLARGLLACVRCCPPPAEVAAKRRRTSPMRAHPSTRRPQTARWKWTRRERPRARFQPRRRIRCAALPTGKVVPCSVDGGQPSQTGYLELDSPGASPIYVCATSWSADPSIGYIFGQPATFMSDPQSCCGGPASGTAAPTVPDSAVGTLGAPHIPSHIKPQEMVEAGSGLLRQNPFAIAVTDATSGAAVTQAMATWLSWGGDGQPHAAPDGTGAYYFASGVSINYVILETSDGFPVIVIGPEVSLTADGTTPIGHPGLGVCAAGGGAALALIARRGRQNDAQQSFGPLRLRSLGHRAGARQRGEVVQVHGDPDHGNEVLRAEIVSATIRSRLSHRSCVIGGLGLLLGCQKSEPDGSDRGANRRTPRQDASTLRTRG